jgi:ADP-ribose pyrophosphatase
LLKRWKKISSKIVTENKYWSYRLDTFDTGSGFENEYHYVHTEGSTMIIPKLDDKFILVEQYRYLNDMTSIEFPCGSIEIGLDEISNAKKELEEETGFGSNELIKIGFFSPYNGVADELCSVFFTDKIFKKESTTDETEEFIIHHLSEDEIENLISKNTIWDGMTLAAWTLFKHWRTQK